MDPRVKDVKDIETALLFDMVVDLEKPANFGDGPFGRRILFGAKSGSFEGPKLRGEVAPGGGDWALFRSDKTMLLDVRLTLRPEDGGAVYMTYGGRWVRSEEGGYFRINALFETGSEQYAWLNDVVAVGSGYLVEGGVAYRVFEVL